MNNAQVTNIDAKPVPLTHLQKKRRSTSSVDRRTYYMGALVLVVVLVVVLSGLFANDLPPIQIDPPSVTEEPAVPGASIESTPLPFEKSQQAIARDRAQTTLAKFVEQQLYLEEHMRVSAWGQAELNASLQQAEQGDFEFAREQYSAAINAYEQATSSLTDLIAKGDQLVEQHLATILAALSAKDHAKALEYLDKAKQIQPEADAIVRLQIRADALPQVIDYLRTAKNHELSSRFDKALNLYQKIRSLDPETSGLNEVVALVQQAGIRERITDLLSAGFAQLDQGAYDAARKTFQRALELDPSDQIAQGGLEQVAKENDLAIITRHQRMAEQALANEQWREAISAYEAVLALDANIQFAVSGLTTATAHRDAKKLLSAIVKEPTRLSSQSLYLDAQQIVVDAKDLSHGGSHLGQLISVTEQLLEQYKEPVTVQLISDNATDIIISNIGRVGFFTAKEVTLRPGQYTIRGSQNGCRDLFVSVLIVPGVEPIDLRCQERL